MYVYIYIYKHTCVYVYIYIYTNMYPWSIQSLGYLFKICLNNLLNALVQSIRACSEFTCAQNLRVHVSKGPCSHDQTLVLSAGRPASPLARRVALRIAASRTEMLWLLLLTFDAAGPWTSPVGTRPHPWTRGFSPRKFSLARAGCDRSGARRLSGRAGRGSRGEAGGPGRPAGWPGGRALHPAVVRCNMVLNHAFRARHVRQKKHRR